MTSRKELVQIARDNWNANQAVDPEVMRDLGYDTPETLPHTIERVLGEEALAGAHLKEVAANDQPAEANLRPRPAAKTPKDKLARDMGESARRKPDPAHNILMWPIHRGRISH